MNKRVLGIVALVLVGVMVLAACGSKPEEDKQEEKQGGQPPGGITSGTGDNSGAASDPTSCHNGAKDSDESGVDCGGPCIAQCL